MSSGVTAIEPSPIDGTYPPPTERSVRTPGIDGFHRADRAGGRIDRDDSGGRIRREVERLVDRDARVALQPRVDRRVHAQSTGAHARLAVDARKLVVHVAEEVRLPDLL